MVGGVKRPRLWEIAGRIFCDCGLPSRGQAGIPGESEKNREAGDAGREMPACGGAQILFPDSVPGQIHVARSTNVERLILDAYTKNTREFSPACASK